MRHHYTPAAARETQGAERRSGKLCLRRRNGTAAIAGVIAPAQIAIRLFLTLGVLRAGIGATGEKESTDCREDGGTDHRRISKMPDYSSLRCTKWELVSGDQSRREGRRLNLTRTLSGSVVSLPPVVRGALLTEQAFEQIARA
jgi:hypothetical protein